MYRRFTKEANSQQKNLKQIAEAIFVTRQLVSLHTAQRFGDIVTNGSIMTALNGLGIHQLSSIQADALPVLLQKEKDVVIINGIGKTLSACIAMVDHVDISKNCPQVLCITATKESAIHTHNMLQNIAKHTHVSIGLIIQDKVDLSQKLKCHILVGSPKEVASFTIMRIYNIENISLCVIDDADVVYTTTLVKEQIIKRLEMGCRKLVITCGHGYHDIVNPPYAVFNDQGLSIQVNIDHYYLKCASHVKFQMIQIVHAILVEQQAQSIIFCSGREIVELIGNICGAKKIDVATLHAGMAMDQRSKEWWRFQNKEVPMIASTNILARGVNISSVRIIINYDLPIGQANFDKKAYKCRSTRCQHFDLKGLVINLIDPSEEPFLCSEPFTGDNAMNEIDFD